MLVRKNVEKAKSSNSATEICIGEIIWNSQISANDTNNSPEKKT